MSYLLKSLPLLGGMLRFKTLSPAPQAIELLIMRAGATGPRSFRWKIQ